MKKKNSELLIVTNNHVVAKKKKKKKKKKEKSSMEAKKKKTDPARDLAVIAVQLDQISDETMDKIAVATMGDSRKLKVGEPPLRLETHWDMDSP